MGEAEMVYAVRSGRCARMFPITNPIKRPDDLKKRRAPTCQELLGNLNLRVAPIAGGYAKPIVDGSAAYYDQRTGQFLSASAYRLRSLINVRQRITDVTNILKAPEESITRCGSKRRVERLLHQNLYKSACRVERVRVGSCINTSKVVTDANLSRCKRRLAGVRAQTPGSVWGARTSGAESPVFPG